MAIPLFLVGLGTLGYLLLAGNQRRKGRRWSGWRTGALLSGAALLALGLLPECLPFSPGDFRRHMLVHLAVGMLAPIGIVMAAPVTLLLRTVPPAWGKWVVECLGSPALRVLAHPVPALALDMGGMAALYFTPLYLAMMTHPALHYLVHLHFLAAGCLYAWVVAGPDPAPRRPSVPWRLVVLGAAIVIHSVLAQLLYAGWHVAVPIPGAQLRRGAELMYYGGDISEMLLAFALVTSWRPRKRRSEDSRKEGLPRPARRLFARLSRMVRRSPSARRS